MQIFTGIVLYLCYWWLAFMIALPCCLRVNGQEQAGFADSAPTNPNIGYKILIATCGAAIMWGITYAMIHYKVINILEL